ncbi:MAG TPA: FHA domain-containing serine/threonine-protein kinase [Ktedonobacteraceae bacterium]|nr:FHA domain-containing serine/threonine-protein kinase [Ktedonobacteraceae bacterium]
MQRDARIIGGVYHIGQIITSGGMLTSCTAHNRNTNSVVGLQIIEFAPTLSPSSIQQLLQPLERRRSIESPHVIHVYDWGIDGNRAYIATDPPRGVTLRHVLDSENIELPRLLDLSRQIALGLKVLHDRGIVGIDLRPPLITVDAVSLEDRVQLDDIGLRALLQAMGYVSSERYDDIGYLDPRYAPPEFMQRGPIGPWSDIYQAGLLLFELATGRLPFVGRNPAETGILQTSSPIPRMVQFKYDVPDALQAVVDQTLAKRPEDRFASIDRFLSALDHVQHIFRPPSAMQPSLQGGKPTSPGYTMSNMTSEMHPIADAVMRAAPIEGLPAVIASSSVTDENKVLAFLSYEVDGVEKYRLAIMEKNVVVGRDDPKRGIHPDIDLTPFDPKMTVSRQHARIRYEETFFHIEDLNSRNGSRLGSARLEPFKPALLKHGDTVRFGSVTLVFKVPGLSELPTGKMPA